MIRALLVGARPEVEAVLAGSIDSSVVRLDIASDAQAALSRASVEPVAVVLLPPGAAQVDVAHHLRRELPSTHLVLLEDPSNVGAARHRALFDPLLGREVSVLPLDPANLGRALEAIATQASQRQAHGSRLERMNAQLASPAPPVERAGLDALRLAALLEQSGDGIFFLELSGRVVVWNATAGRQFGWQGAGPTDLGLAWAPGEVGERARGGAWSVELDRNGRALEISFAPVRDARDALIGVSAIACDVTDRRDALVAARKLAEFEQLLIGIVSHDLRNPLAAITLGAQAMLRNEELDQRTRTGASRILSASQRATRLIHDLLDLTHTRLKGTLPIDRRPTDLRLVLPPVLDELRLAHAGRTLEFESIGDARGAWDPDRLAQVLTNLVVNALTYSAPASPVKVRVVGGTPHTLISVHNAGPPIAPDQLESLFRPFRRGAEGDLASRSIGLGLYITDQIVRAHGGQIEVTSNAQGTTFIVTLPADVAASST